MPIAAQFVAARPRLIPLFKTYTPQEIEQRGKHLIRRFVARDVPQAETITADTLKWELFLLTYEWVTARVRMRHKIYEDLDLDDIVWNFAHRAVKAAPAFNPEKNLRPWFGTQVDWAVDDFFRAKS